VVVDTRTDGRWLAVTSETARSAVLLCAATAFLLLSCIVAARALLAERHVPPWVEVALFGASAAAALAGAITIQRISTRRGDAPVEAGPAATPPAAAVPPVRAEAAEPEPPPAALEHFQVDTRTGRLVIAAAELEWIEASGNYVTLHLPGKSFLYRMPLVRLEREMDTTRFLRVHRSAMVNVTAVRRVEPLPSGDADAWLASGARVRVSRRYARAFHERTGRPR
jgi:DNA-binding LytR/AlgR family response regulator